MLVELEDSKRQVSCAPFIKRYHCSQQTRTRRIDKNAAYPSILRGELSSKAFRLYCNNAPAKVGTTNRYFRLATSSSWLKLLSLVSDLERADAFLVVNQTVQDQEACSEHFQTDGSFDARSYNRKRPALFQ